MHLRVDEQAISFESGLLIVCIVKGTGVKQEKLSLQFCIRLTSQIDQHRSSIEENKDLYPFPVVQWFSWLLQNNFQVGETDTSASEVVIQQTRKVMLFPKIKYTLWTIINT